MLTTPPTWVEEAGCGQELTETGGGGGGAAAAGVLWRNEAGRGGKQNPEKWQIGRPNALRVGLEGWGRRARMSQGRAGWVWVEIQGWRTTCCLPELCYHKACFQRLHPTDGGRKTRREGREERTEQQACKQRDGQQVKEKGGKRKRRKEEQRREGAEKRSR